MAPDVKPERLISSLSVSKRTGTSNSKAGRHALPARRNVPGKKRHDAGRSVGREIGSGCLLHAGDGDFQRAGNRLLDVPRRQGAKALPYVFCSWNAARVPSPVPIT